MFIVTNTIRVKTEAREEIFQQFKSSHTLDQMIGVKGFVSFEVFYRNITDEEGLSEVVALSRWNKEEDQIAWMKSNSFKSLHQHPKEETSADSSGEKQVSPVIGNTVSRYYSE